MNEHDHVGGDAEMTMPAWDPAPPGVARPVSGRGRRRKRERAAVVLARATIPSALLLAVLLPILGIGWFLLPGDAPLKVGQAPLATGVAASSLLFGLAAILLMRLVAKNMRAGRERGVGASLRAGRGIEGDHHL